MADLTLAALRAQYPTPISDCDRRFGDGEYCVAGAVCLGLRAHISTAIEDWHFPGEMEFAHALIDLNPDLDADEAEDLEDTQAWEFANAIVDTNDIDRDFDAAWRWVEQALAYRHP